MSQVIGDSAGFGMLAHVKISLVPTALFVEHQTPGEVARRYGVHRSWVYKLKARHEADGEAAFEPRSRRPKTMPAATDAATV